MRGIGVAVMCSRCGASPPRALRVERRALAHAEAVLLVDDGEREALELDRVLDQRVRPDQQPQLARGAAARAPRAARAPASSRSAGRPAAPASSPPRPRTGRRRSGSRSSRSAARRASPSGAISAACMPASATRSIAYSATTVFPDPTSPISRRCIGLPAREVAVDLLERLALAVGQLERQRLEPARDERRRARRAARPRAPRGACGAASTSASWNRNSSSNASRRRADRHLLERPRPVRGAQRVGRAGQARAGAQPRRQRLDRVALEAAQHPTQARGCAAPTGPRSPGTPARGRSCAGRGPRRRRARSRARRPGRSARRARPRAPAQQHPRPCGELVGEVGLVEPDRLQRARCRRPPGTRGSSAAGAAWAARGSAHLHGDRRLLADRQLGDGRGCARSRGGRRADARAGRRPSRCRASPRCARPRGRRPRARSAARASRRGRGSERSGAASSASRVCGAPLPKARGGACAFVGHAIRLGPDEDRSLPAPVPALPGRSPEGVAVLQPRAGDAAAFRAARPLQPRHRLG